MRYGAATEIDAGLADHEDDELAFELYFDDGVRDYITDRDDDRDYDERQNYDDYLRREEQYGSDDDWDGGSDDEPYWSDLPPRDVTERFLAGYINPPEDVEFDHRWRAQDERQLRGCNCIACETRREEDAAEDALVDTRFPVGGERT